MSLNDTEVLQADGSRRSGVRDQRAAVALQRTAPGKAIEIPATGQDARFDNPLQVEFRAASKTFDGRTHAVASLDLAIGKGEFVTLLGPSGSGKTTSLMMLAGFEEPTSGDILIAGRSLKGTSNNSPFRAW